MPKYNLFFHSNKLPETFEEGEKDLEAIKAWSKSFDRFVVNPGRVLKQSMIVKADEVQTLPVGETLSAYAEIEVLNSEEAVQVAKSWPILASGHVIISEVVDMELD